jgi:malonyl-CoA O-methyltransferase
MKGTLSVKFSRSAKTYDRWALPQRECAKILVEMVRPEGSVLDVGCGTGFVTHFLKDRRYAVGLDISPGMVRVYRERFGRAVVGDAESLPFSDESFDWAISNFSLHWTDLSKSVPELLRVARVGVGLALPVKGSLEGIGFPFPEEEEVLRHFPRTQEVKTKEVRIPFSGWDLVRFFHFTGSSLNPTRRGPLPRGEILSLLEALGEPKFRVLFLYARRV